MPITAIPLTPLQLRYVDINTNYTLNSNLFLLSDVKVINNQLFNLFTTYLGEADYEPEYGSTLPNRLFDLLPGTSELLENDLFIATKRWMSDKIEIDPAGIRAIPNYQLRAYDLLIRYYLIARQVTVDYGVRMSLINQER